MSQWGSLDASFVVSESAAKDIFSRCPMGSEGPAGLHHRFIDDELCVWGRLRDVYDKEDAREMLDWFTGVCVDHNVATASITWDYDRGPRYRYTWDASRMFVCRKVKGILDA